MNRELIIDQIMHNQKTVLIIVDRFYPYIGGAETLFLHKAKEYYQQGHNVIVLTSKFEPTLADEELHDRGKIIRIGSSRYTFALWSLSLARILQKQHNIQIIHTSSNYSMWSVWALSFFSKAKTIITMHEIYGGLRIKLFGRMRGFPRLIGEKLSLAITNFDEYQCVSLYTLNSLRIMTLIPDNKLILAKNTIDVTFWDKTQCDHIAIEQLKKTYEIQGKKIGLFFGRLSYIKGLDIILNVLPEIVGRHPDFCLVVISPYDKELSNLVTSQLSNCILWIEQVSQEELRDRIGLSNICILPSKAEGFGYAIAEAASMNANIITTQIGAIPEVLGDYENVSYIELGNKGQLVEKITSLIS